MTIIDCQEINVTIDESAQYIISLTEPPSIDLSFDAIPGATKLIELVDTPQSYIGEGNKFLQVKEDESGIKFTDSLTTTSWSSIIGDQTDINLSGFTNDLDSDDIPEGIVNLYFSGKTTDNLTEGTTNLYDKTVTLTEGGNVTITGTYPDFTINAVDTTYTASDFDIKDLTDSNLLRTTWSAKQDALVSGTNIKSINNSSILAAGDLSLQTPLGAGTDYEVPLTFSDGITRTLNAISNSDKGSSAVGTHESSYNHANYNDAYSKRVDSWTTPLSFNTNTASISQSNTTTSGYLSSTDWNTFNNKQDALGFTPENIANKGQNNGYADLDAGGKIPLTRLPSTLLVYKGVWNADTNTPTLTATDENKKGWVYNVGVPGTQFGIAFSLGDWAIYNDAGVLEKSDNSDDVVSVNGQQGVVVLDADDISDTLTTNKFVTTTEKNTWNGKQDALTNPVTGTGTANYIPKFTATSGIGNSIIYDDGTKVGIGTTSPSVTLDVAGQGRFSSQTYPSLEVERNVSGGAVYAGMKLQRISASPSAGVGIGQYFTAPNSNGAETHTGFFGGRLSTINDGSEIGELVFTPSFNGIDPYNKNPTMIVKATAENQGDVLINGNVGIGTTTPSQKLDVAGNINIDPNSAYLFDGNAALKLSKNGEANYHSTLVGQGSGNAGNINSTRQTALGYAAGSSNTGIYQTAVGYNAGQSNTGSRQTALGYAAGSSNTGIRVTGIGYEATRNNSGNDVVAIGYQAGKDNNVANQFIVKQANINAVPLIQGDFATGNVGIGTTSPDYKLEVMSPTDGALAHIYTDNSTRSQGLYISTNLTSPYTVTLASSGNSAGDFAFNTGNTERLRIERTNGYVGIGTTTPSQKLDVAGNINIDPNSAYLFDGNAALKLSKNGEANYHSTLVGQGSGNAGNINSTRQTALGYTAGRENTGASQTAIGYSAGYQNTGSSQTAIGYSAGYQNTGSRQTALGYAAGSSNTGIYQTAVGYNAGQSNSGDYQTAVGYAAGLENTGDRVIGVGYEATKGNLVDDVVAIGCQAGKGNAVANQFIVKQANINAVPLIQGDFASGNVGIGTTSPAEKLDVVGNINLTGLLKIDDVQVLKEQQEHIEDLKTDYTTGDLDTEAEIITAINTTNAKINAILAMLETHGLVASS